MSTSSCIENCNGNGLCVLGRFTCNNGYYGDVCELKNCYNSLVYIDIDTLDP